jgi:oleate hydratase
MECLWYLCAKVPSLEHRGRTVLDDVVDFNKDEPIHSECRALVDRGHIYSRIHDFSTSPETRAKLVQLMLEPEEQLEDLTIEEYFGKDSDFFDSTTWLISHSMLAFKPYHSVLEFQRYLLRFSLATRLEYLEGIVHTKYNEFDAIIKPILVWLDGHGVNILTDCTVTDIQLDAACNTVTGLDLRRADEPISMPVSTEDLVFVTNGSMTQNTRHGDNTTVAATDRSTADRGVFTLWEKLAAKDPKFGSPKKFISDIDRTKWMSFFPTIKGYPEFVERLETLTGSTAGTGGGITIKDSSWGLGIILHHKPFFPDQADNEDVFWGYGLSGENEGDHVTKPMCEYTGNEILTELLYHLDLLDMKDELLAHTSVSTAMMPYITSQFMPHKISDRPRIVPDGCTNLAFIGQYVEVPGEAVFTVEMSVRTGLEGVYRLTDLDKDIIEVYPSRYDIRYRLEQIKKDLGITGPIRPRDLPKVRLSTLLHWRKASRQAPRAGQLDPTL